MQKTYPCWGKHKRATPTAVFSPAWQTDPAPTTILSRLAYGCGRSYGDVCLNDGGAIVNTSSFKHILAFNEETGVLRCESGLTLGEILAFSVPRKWFLPVTPGTKFVTVGGAIANDVHGKNHHHAGTFGRHVSCFELLRSNNERLFCSPSENKNLFSATIGGLGLTGVITWAEIQLKKITGPFIEQTNQRFSSLEEFFGLSAAADVSDEYTVAWLDSTAPRSQLGRGIFMSGNHVATAMDQKPVHAPISAPIPFDLPDFALNPLSIHAFNTVFLHKEKRQTHTFLTHYEPFFYPLDRLTSWNRLYGKRGFLQYQCVLPTDAAVAGLRELLTRMHDGKLHSFLSVLKVFGSLASPGMLSFPRAGATIALDVPYTGPDLIKTLRDLDQLVLHYGGRLYPAKDAHMLPETFQACYPQWKSFSAFVDPGHSSDFWRRVTSSL